MRRITLQKVLFIMVLLLESNTKLFSQSIYGVKGIKPESVIQGSMGSCYFHSAIASLAKTNPEKINSLIKTSKAGESWQVQFANNKIENVYYTDVDYARKNGYDLSDGIWVCILYRAYAQNILRVTLMKTIDKYPIPQSYKNEFENLIINSDQVLLMYDRLIRKTVSQNFTFEENSFKSSILNSLSKSNLSIEVKLLLAQYLSSPLVIQNLNSMLNNYGEVFGAYRDVGNGGLPIKVFRSFIGSSDAIETIKKNETSNKLMKCITENKACVAGSFSKEFDEIDKDLTAKKWYVPKHAYSIIDFDGENVTLRNPWGKHPDPDGIFVIDFDTFCKYFEWVVTQ